MQIQSKPTVSGQLWSYVPPGSSRADSECQRLDEMDDITQSARSCGRSSNTGSVAGSSIAGGRNGGSGGYGERRPRYGSDDRGSEAGGAGGQRPLYERDPPTSLDFSGTVLDQFRKVVLMRAGCGGVAALERTFNQSDTRHNGEISVEDLRVAFKHFGLRCEEKDLQLLLRAVKKLTRGCTYDNLLMCLRGPVPKRRAQLIDSIFDSLEDKKGRGVLRFQSLECYDTRYDPDVRSGKLSAEEALPHLLSFMGNGKKDEVSHEDFAAYYHNVSAVIDDDDSFEEMLRGMWRVPGDARAGASRSSMRISVTLATGEQRVLSVPSSIDARSRSTVLRQLAKQGVSNVVDFALKQPAKDAFF